MRTIDATGDMRHASLGSRVADAWALDSAYLRQAGRPRPPGHVWHHAAADRVQLIALPLHASMPHICDYARGLRRMPEMIEGARRAPVADPREREARRAQCAALERQIEIRLPDAFRQYLEDTPGGPALEFIFAGPDGERERIDGWLGLARNDAYSLLGMAARAVDQLPEGTLPFAFDAFGNLLLLDLRDASAPVRFFEHDLAPDDDQRHCRIVARDFASFLAAR